MAPKVAEVKLKSEVSKLRKQVPETEHRLQSFTIRLGNEEYVPHTHAKPGENRLYTAADLRSPATTKWIIAAPHDAFDKNKKPARAWELLQKETSDRGVGRPSRSVRVIRLPSSNAEVRKYAEHLLNILVDDVLTENEGVKGQPARLRR